MFLYLLNWVENFKLNNDKNDLHLVKYFISRFVVNFCDSATGLFSEDLFPLIDLNEFILLICKKCIQ